MKYFKIGFAFFLLIYLISIRDLLAYQSQGHVVSIQEVQKQIESQSSERTENIQEIQKLLRHSEVQKHLGSLYDLQKIEVTVATLDDKTLEDLAGRSRLANDQLQAGISKGMTIVVIILVVVIIVGISLSRDGWRQILHSATR